MNSLEMKNNLNILYEEFKNKIKTSETIISELKENFEMKIEFIRESIQIRIESLKIELEKLEEKLNHELNQYKKHWTSDFKMSGGMEFNKEEYQNSLEEIESLIKNKIDLNEANLYKFQNKIKILNEYIEKCRDLAPDVSFIDSESKLNENLIGEIVFGDVIQRIKSNKYKTINIDNCRPYDVCILPNGNTLVCNYLQCNMVLFDTNNELIRTIDTIGTQSVRVVSACSNGINAAYLSEFSSHMIIKTDLNFNTQLALFGTSCQRGTDNVHLNNPRGICFNNNSVYVCDNGNKRIQILNEDLSYQQSIKLNYEPGYIKVLNNVACVRMDDVQIICFYDLKTFNEIKRYDHNGIIGVYRQGFIEYFHTTKSFYCYDKNGDLLEQIETKNDFGVLSNTFGGIVVNERSNKFILCHRDRSALIFFNCKNIHL